MENVVDNLEWRLSCFVDVDSHEALLLLLLLLLLFEVSEDSPRKVLNRPPLLLGGVTGTLIGTAAGLV